MSYRVVIDSCGEFTEELKKDEHFVSVPLSIMVDDEVIVDDKTFNQAEFLKKVAASPNCPKSACPSPESYMKAYEGEDENVYVVTLSERLSGSYNSAILGKNLYMEENKKKNIHVFNSCSASIGETLIGMKIKELEEEGLNFKDVISKVNEYIQGMHTYFVLESLETLRKNGRISNLKALAAEVLNIKPVMGATPEGEICKLSQTRGMKKALETMVDYMISETKNYSFKTLAISHCNCIERAELLKKIVEEKMAEKKEKFKEIFIIDTDGISSLYAGDGGVIMVV